MAACALWLASARITAQASRATKLCCDILLECGMWNVEGELELKLKAAVADWAVSPQVLLIGMRLQCFIQKSTCACYQKPQLIERRQLQAELRAEPT